MKKYVCSVMVATLILTLFGCKSSKRSIGDEHYPLIGTQWNLVTLDGEKIGNDFALRPFITFDSTGNIQGNLGCNTFFGTYTVNKKHKLTISYQGSTKRLCQQMSVEKRFSKALKSDINRYEIEGEYLILLAGDEEVMRFAGVDLSKVE